MNRLVSASSLKRSLGDHRSLDLIGQFLHPGFFSFLLFGQNSENQRLIAFERLLSFLQRFLLDPGRSKISGND